MFEFPQVQDEDADGEPVISIVSLLLAALIVGALVAAIGFGTSYFLKGVGLAAFLPAWRDHNTEARQEWIAEQGQKATRVEWVMLKTCAVAFVLAVVYAVVTLGVPA